MIRFFKLKPMISLLIISILSGLFWRVELQLHGWRGLGWLNYFHFSLPIILGLLLVWINSITELSLIKRIFYNITFLVALAIVLIGAFLSVSYYNPKIIGAALYINYGKNAALITKTIWIGSIILTPLMFALLSKIALQEINWKRITIGSVLYWFSFPIAMALIWLFNHKGLPNYLNAIKSGIVFPFLILGIGILSLQNSKKNV